MAGLAAIIVAGLVGVSLLARGADGNGLPPAGPSPTTPVLTPSGPPTSESEPAGSAIPDAALLQLADVNSMSDGSDGGRAFYDLPATESVLPGLCGASFASEEKVTARRVVDATYFPVGPPPQLPEGTFSESITTYEQGGAEQFLTEVRAAVTACPTDSDQVVPLRYTTVEENLSADDAITIIEEGTYTLVGNTRVESRRPIRVIRVGDSVLVLGFHSWEHLSFDQAIADAVRDRAIARFTEWAR